VGVLSVKHGKHEGTMTGLGVGDALELSPPHPDVTGRPETPEEMPTTMAAFTLKFAPACGSVHTTVP
jgi:hypothetical protein